jgi:hypothetical protein
MAQGPRLSRPPRQALPLTPRRGLAPEAARVQARPVGGVCRSAIEHTKEATSYDPNMSTVQLY